MMQQSFNPSVDTRPTVSLDLDVNLGELHLEIPCPKCEGQKTVRGQECPGCRGIGRVPTANGARLLGFLRRHLK